ncbi:kelch repeat-containing protein [Pontimicrobium sp. SW4]|uniref:Kelch repeat-containing protein n=1 Tax=Pontimicrobium sp. SW4 TaxID=3153519 RepID=A0AAU7BV83_9FLAO
MQKIYVSVLLVLVSYTLQAQQVVTILDSDTKQIISDVNIKIKETDKGFATNNKGVFTINSTDNLKNSDILIISHINYYPEKITFNKIKELNYTIYLLKNYSSLDEIVVSAKEKRIRRREQLIKFRKVTTMPKGLFAFGASQKDGKVIITGGEKSIVTNSFGEITSKDKVNEFGTSMEKMLESMIIKANWKNYSSKVHVYDLNKNMWSDINKKNIKRAFHNSHIYDNKLYVVGGKRVSNLKGKEYLENRIEILNLDKNTKTIDDVNPHKAVNFASFIYKDNLIVLGGSIKSTIGDIKTFSKEVHALNLQTGLWYNIGNMPIPKETQGVLIEDTIFLIGGYNNDPTNNIETFNLKTGRWTKEGELFQSMINPGVFAIENMIYIFNDGTFFTYNIKTKRLSEYKIKLDLHSPKIFLNNNKLYLFGGFSVDDFSVIPSNSVFSIELSEFENFKIIKSKIL